MSCRPAPFPAGNSPASAPRLAAASACPPPAARPPCPARPPAPRPRARRLAALLATLVLGPLAPAAPPAVPSVPVPSVPAPAHPASAPLTVAVDPPRPGPRVPADFVGLSFETSNLLPDRDGRYLFSAENLPLIMLFRNAGIKSLRIGGGTAEIRRYAVPGPRDLDALFAFARAADVRILYTLRLLHGDRDQAATLAAYIARHHRDRLDSFCLGNEPDWHAYHSYPGRVEDPNIFEAVPGEPGSAYPSYLAHWRAFADAIRRVVPDAVFSGPDTGSNFPVAGAKDTRHAGRSWTEAFARDLQPTGLLTAALAHDYVGQDATGVSVPQALAAMLSPAWLETHYPALFTSVLARVQALGLPYRLTECNDHTGGVPGASNAYAAALWALDYLHWHAAHGAAGLNFHNKRWIYTDTIYLHAPSGELRFYPKAYGLRAFALGSTGRSAPVALRNPAAVNATAYAIADDDLCQVTIINKEYGATARAVQATLVLPPGFATAQALWLTAPGGDVCAQQGITLGGATMDHRAPWAGTWTPLPLDPAGRAAVRVPPAAAVVVQLRRRP